MRISIVLLITLLVLISGCENEKSFSPSMDIDFDQVIKNYSLIIDNINRIVDTPDKEEYDSHFVSEELADQYWSVFKEKLNPYSIQNIYPNHDKKTITVSITLGKEESSDSKVYLFTFKEFDQIWKVVDLEAYEALKDSIYFNPPNVNINHQLSDFKHILSETKEILTAINTQKKDNIKESLHHLIDSGGKYQFTHIEYLRYTRGFVGIDVTISLGVHFQFIDPKNKQIQEDGITLVFSKEHNEWTFYGMD